MPRIIDNIHVRGKNIPNVNRLNVVRQHLSQTGTNLSNLNLRNFLTGDFSRVEDTASLPVPKLIPDSEKDNPHIVFEIPDPNDPEKLIQTLKMFPDNITMENIIVNNNIDTQNLTAENANLNNTNITGDLDVTGNGNFDTLLIDSSAQINSLFVTGTSSLNNTNITGDLDVTGNGNFDNTFISGSLIATRPSLFSDSLTVEGETECRGDLDLRGDIILFGENYGERVRIHPGPRSMEFQTEDSPFSFTTRYLIEGGSDTANFRWYTGTYDAPTEILSLIGSTQRLGVNTTNPEYNLEVTGTGRFSDSLRVGGKLRTGELDVRSALTVNSIAIPVGTYLSLSYNEVDGKFYRSASSIRYKDKIAGTVYGLKETLQLNPVRFQYKSEDGSGQILQGLIAEEVEPVSPDYVLYDAEKKPDSINYQNMVSMLIKATQEQQTLINDLTTKLSDAEARISQLESYHSTS